MLRGYGRKLFPMVGVEPPFTLGRDVVGEIVALGPLAWNFREGQRVVAATHPTADGAHAEYTVCAETGAAQPCPAPHAPAAQRAWCAAAATLLPDGVATAHAAALPFAALTAWRALHGLAAVAPGQTVLVHGAAGSVGSFATQYLRHHGCRVLATCRPTQIEQVRQDCGPDAAVMSVDDFLAATAEGSEAGEGGAGHDLGCDVVLDGLGKGVAEGELQRHSLRVLKPGGAHPLRSHALWHG